MENLNEKGRSPDYTPDQAADATRTANAKRFSPNVSSEIFNQNELLKRLLQDDIAEGM